MSIVSSDKDLMQLVSKDIRLYDPMKNKVIGEKEVIEKFGVKPNQVIDVQSLAGDSSDNIPGVPGIGIKTAAELINKYKDLDTLLKKAIREGLIKCECSSCGTDFNIEDKSPPLMLDFLDKDTQNTHIDNLRTLCFNCIYIISKTNKGWYKHRRNPIRLSLNDIPADVDVKMTELPSEEPEVDYMPFEEFQKLL